MDEFRRNKKQYKAAMRSTYIILPIKYTGELDLKSMKIDKSDERDFQSDDFASVLNQKCSKDSNFVRRFILQSNIMNNGIACSNNNIIKYINVKEIQLFIFNNGIGFISFSLIYPNEDTKFIYNLINPGYLKSKDENLNEKVASSINNLVSAIVVNGKSKMFELYVEKETLALKESYLFNAAYVSEEFKQLDTLKKISFNLHKIIDISRDFIDLSETDLEYTFGGRNVEKETYRWGSCIASQSISYVYAVKKDENVMDRDCDESEEKDDLLLTIYVLYQKYTCMFLNEKIQAELISKNKKKSLKNILKLKKSALEFRAMGTLTPTQVSRWNNVCDTYKYLLRVNGVNDALEEIEQKINLINGEYERMNLSVQSYIGTMIAVFGLISIIDSAMSIVTLVEGGSSSAVISLGVSCIVILAFVFSWLIMNNRRK